MTDLVMGGLLKKSRVARAVARATKLGRATASVFGSFIPFKLWTG